MRIDRGIPTAPTVSGGSLAWQNVASVTISATSGTDSGSGLAGYQYRLSIDGGASWGSPVSGAAATISAQGETLVQFRSIDLAGNVSAWAPGTTDATDTVRVDRTPPVVPTVSGGSLAWQSVNSVTISALRVDRHLGRLRPLRAANLDRRRRDLDVADDRGRSHDHRPR